MLQVQRILQLLKDGKSERKIASELHIGRNTLKQYVSKIEATGQQIPVLLKLPEATLAELVFADNKLLQPDERYKELEKKAEYFQKELTRVGVTKLLLWKEYREEFPKGYGYSQFCEHLNDHTRKNCATMHFEHKPGERLQIDFAGDNLKYIDRSTGEIHSCAVLTCELPFSGLSYVEALPSASHEFFFPALCRCIDYLGGVPENVLSDNMKQWVTKSSRYEPVFNEISERWALHYNTSLSATRVAKPKDKPSVENLVHITYMRIYALMRNEEFFSINELNHRIMNLLEIHNHTNFQGRTYSRYDRFIQYEKPFLRASPAEHFVLKHTTMAKVQKNYHIILGEDKHQYSIPYQYIAKKVKVVYDSDEVEIYLGFKRIAIHKRNYCPHAYTTLAEHMPKKHQKYNETKGWDEDYFLQKAKEIGKNSFQVMKRIIEDRNFPQQAFHACQGLLRLSSKYGKERFEKACKRALPAHRIGYRMIENILKNNLDKQEDAQLNLFSTPIPNHENIRGPQNYF